MPGFRQQRVALFGLLFAILGELELEPGSDVGPTENSDDHACASYTLTNRPRAVAFRCLLVFLAQNYHMLVGSGGGGGVCVCGVVCGVWCMVRACACV